jgi:hypothetical protein
MKFNGKQMGRKFGRLANEFSARMVRATNYAAKRTAEYIETEGRADIAAGGDFGSDRWQQGFRAKISYQRKGVITINVTHDVFYWRVFEYGAVIRGKPLLWIPLSFAKDAQGVRARDYPGPLFRVDRLAKGKKPLLLTTGGVPKYFGTPKVRIKRKWHLRRILKKAQTRMTKFYKEGMKRGG